LLQLTLNVLTSNNAMNYERFENFKEKAILSGNESIT